MRALMTRKSCAVGMRNAILRNYLNRISLSLLHSSVGLNILAVRYIRPYNTRLRMQCFAFQEFINTLRPHEKMDRFASSSHHENCGLSQEAISHVYFPSVSKRGLILNHTSRIAFDRHEYELVASDKGSPQT